jgi:RNA polymerase sigma factor (sigma-70 family)
MTSSGPVAATQSRPLSDVQLVARVRAGDDAAFEELYRRYHHRIRSFVQGRLRDSGRAEDVTQEAFIAALRRLRVTNSEIAFKPWLFEIARNGAIDMHRRSSRAEEVPIDEDTLLRAADRSRLAGAPAPDAEVFTRERLEFLGGALDQLPDVHYRALVMRELEGRSYREIGERLDLTRSAVESTLFRARRRLEHEYAELEAGRHCESSRATMALIAGGMDPGSRRQRRFVRHTRRCVACFRYAHELGVAPRPRVAGLRERAAALLPIPLVLRRRAAEASAEGAGSGGSLAGPGLQLGGGVMERAASLLAVAALAGAGGAAIHGSRGVDPPARPADVRAAPVAEQVPAGRRSTAARHGLPPGTGALTGDRHERAGAPKAARRRDGFNPAPVEGRQAQGQSISASPASAGGVGIEVGEPSRPSAPELPRATREVVSSLENTADAVVSVGTAPVQPVQEVVTHSEAPVDATRQGATGLLGQTGERLPAIPGDLP